MGNQVISIGGTPGAGVDAVGVQVDRTIIAAQTTPTAIKLGQGNVYAIEAYVSGTASAFVQYFNHGGTTLGVSTPLWEMCIPNGTTCTAGAVARMTFSPPITFASNATTSGIWIAAGVAQGTGTNVAASTVTVYTLYA